MRSIAVILLLIIRVKSQDIASSGDGELSTTEYAALIDENGDMENITVFDVFSTAKNHFTEAGTTPEQSTFASQSTLVTESTTVTALPSTESTTVTDTVSTTVTDTESTTVTDTESTTVIDTESATVIYTESTTVTDTESTAVTDTESTTITALPPTVRSTLREIPTTTTSRASTERAAYVPANGEKYCSLVDNSFHCEEEIVCYGEGYIDCTQDIEMSLTKTTLMEKISSLSMPDEYSEYEEGIETYPPYLVGKSTKKSLPFLFKMRSLGTTENSLENTESTQVETFTEVMLRNDSNSPSIEELVNEENVETTWLNVGTESVFLEKTSEAFDDLKDVPSTTIFLFDTNSTQESENNSSLTEMAFKMNTTGDIVTNVQNVTEEITTAVSSSSTMEDTTEKLINIRKKREENIASSSKFMSFNAGNIRKSVKACKLIGNLICTPSPTMAKCRGKSACQVLSNTTEISEKSTSPKALENWIIVVIAVCAVGATFTLALFAYLVVTSWKKLKVRPHGVTTLTYVNSTIP